MRRHRVQNKYTINFNKKIQEAMLRAGLSYKGKPVLCSKARAFAPYRAFSVQWKVTRPAKGSPFGGAVTEGD